MRFIYWIYITSAYAAVAGNPIWANANKMHCSS